MDVYYYYAERANRPLLGLSLTNLIFRNDDLLKEAKSPSLRPK